MYLSILRSPASGNCLKTRGMRTGDPKNPMQVRYQAAPRPDRTAMIAENARGVSRGAYRRRILISSSSSRRI
jgi:hypothetical protein